VPWFDKLTTRLEGLSANGARGCRLRPNEVDGYTCIAVGRQRVTPADWRNAPGKRERSSWELPPFETVAFALCQGNSARAILQRR